MQKFQLSPALTISIGKSLLSNNSTDTYEPNMEQEYIDYGNHIINIFCGIEKPNFSRIAEWFKKSKNKQLTQDCSMEDLFNFPIRFQRYLATGLLNLIVLSRINSLDDCKDINRRCESYVHDDLVAVNQEIFSLLMSHDHSCINIAGLDKAAVFVALYSAASRLIFNLAAKAQQSGFQSKSSLSLERAREILKDQQSFDYFQGAALKLHFIGDEISVHSYNNNYGFCFAQKTILPLMIARNQNVMSLSLQDRCVRVIKSDLPIFWSRLPTLREAVREKYRDLETNPINLFNYELSDFIRKYPCQSFEAKVFLQLYEGCHVKGNRHNAVNTVFLSNDFKKIPEEKRNLLSHKIFPLLTARHAKTLDDQKMSAAILDELSSYTPKEFDTQCLQQLILCRNQNNKESVKKVHALLKEEPPCMADQKLRVRKPLLEMIKKYNERVKKALEMQRSKSDLESTQSPQTL